MVPRFQTGLDAAALPTQGDPTPTGRPPGKLLARLGTHAGECRLIWRNEAPCLSRSPTYPETSST
jgi:hypothetical protein